LPTLGGDAVAADRKTPIPSTTAWRCPACRIQILHSPIETRPQRGQRYRCHICRLELGLSEDTSRLDVLPLDPADANHRSNNT